MVEQFRIPQNLSKELLFEVKQQSARISSLTETILKSPNDVTSSDAE